MAREFGLVSVSIWNSRKFTSLPTDDARLLYLYLLTCPSANSLGCFVLKSGYAAADLGWDQDRFGYGIDTLCKASLIGIDRVESLVRVIGFLDHSEIMNVKHGAGALKVALALPDCEQKALLFKDLQGRKHVDAAVVQAEIDRLSHTVSIPYANGMDKPEPEPEPEPEPKEQQQPREAAPSKSSVDNSTVQVETGLDTKPGAVRESAGAALQPGAVRVAAQPETQSERADRRVKLLSAMGVGPDGIAGPSRFVGTEADMVEADKWAALGLSTDDQCRLIIERMERMRRKNPRFAVGSFAYFTGAMADLAAAKAAPVPTGTAKPQSDRDAKLARYAKIAGQWK